MQHHQLTDASSPTREKMIANPQRPMRDDVALFFNIVKFAVANLSSMFACSRDISGQYAESKRSSLSELCDRFTTHQIEQGDVRGDRVTGSLLCQVNDSMLVCVTIHTLHISGPFSSSYRISRHFFFHV